MNLLEWIYNPGPSFKDLYLISFFLRFLDFDKMKSMQIVKNNLSDQIV